MANKTKIKKSRFIPFILILIVIIGIICIVAFNLTVNSAKKPFNEADTSYVAITIPSGSSTTRIANILEENGIIKDAKMFKLLCKKEGYDGRFQAGDYHLSPSMDAESLMQTLCFGYANTVKLTIIEGLRIEEVGAKLESMGICTYDEFMAVAGDKEGKLFPNTYDIYENATVTEIVDMLTGQFNKVWNEVGGDAACAATGYTPDQILVMASIIEKEARASQDRELISSVIYNRLSIGMPLQMDATIVYALNDDKGYTTYADLEVDSPYNTYKNQGLPPGPICSPGKASIEAALHPAQTDYIYYVVSPKLDGSHVFSATYAEFEQNKAAYYAALNAQ